MQHLHLRINELLIKRGCSKNRICKDLDIPRGNFNRFCRDEFQRIDANLLLKLCDYFNCTIDELIEIIEQYYKSVTCHFFALSFIMKLHFIKIILKSFTVIKRYKLSNRFLLFSLYHLSTYTKNHYSLHRECYFRYNS